MSAATSDTRAWSVLSRGRGFSARSMDVSAEVDVEVVLVTETTAAWLAVEALVEMRLLLVLTEAVAIEEGNTALHARVGRGRRGGRHVERGSDDTDRY